MERRGWFASADSGAESARTDDERVADAGVARSMKARKIAKLIRRAKAADCTVDDTNK